MKNKKEQNQDKIGLFLELFTEDNNKLKLDIKNYLTSYKDRLKRFENIIDNPNSGQ